MKYPTSTGQVLFMLLISAFAAVPVSYSQSRQMSDQISKQVRPFRYVIVGNDEQSEYDRRAVQILMDPKAFSESNLRILFSLVSKRFPKPELLYISVATSLEQLSTPEEEDYGTVSSSPTPSYVGKYYWATYIRGDDSEFFRYSPLNDKTDVKTVELRPSKK